MAKVMLICGDRNWDDEDLIRNLLVTEKPDCVIEGEARGADKISRKVAASLNIQVLPFPAEWGKFGKAAGPIRNREMLKKLMAMIEEGWDGEVVACHDNIETSKGTKNMIDQAVKAKVPCRVMRHV